MRDETFLTGTPAEDTHADPGFAALLDEFFATYYRRRPVNATFIGKHEYDEFLPDYAETAIADTLAEMQSLRQRLAQHPETGLTLSQKIDRRLCSGFLDIQCWEFEQRQVVRGNPCVYTGEAIFGLLSLFLSDFAPLGGRVSSATARLQSIAQLLRQGRANIGEAPAPWIKLALTECRGAIQFLCDKAPSLPGNAATGEYQAGVEAATAAFREYGAWLETDLNRTDVTGCGAETLAMHLQSAHCLEEQADDIVRYAESELATAADYLAAHCSDFNATDSIKVLDSLCDIHPSVDEYYDRYQDTWDEMRQIALHQSLVTWPDFPLRYIPQPEWARDVAADLYFLFYRSPAAFNRPPVHHYLVTPIDASMPPETQVHLLRANNDSTIKLNHVVHHGGIGHHVQNWHAFRATSRVGQIAAVDCASRIAMNCGGTMAEGWACYATDLMAEAGGLTAAECYAEQHTRTRMCARAIVDLRLHRGDLSFADAVSFYRETTGMGREAAVYETTRNSMYPGMAVMYLTGTDAIHQLRKTLRERDGHDFNLRDFHDRFLAHGSIPVALIAENMRSGENQTIDKRATQ